MIDTPDRRSFLKVAAATGALGAVGAPEAGAETAITNLRLATPRPFSFETLKDEAQRLVREPFRAPATPDPEITAQNRLRGLGPYHLQHRSRPLRHDQRALSGGVLPPRQILQEGRARPRRRERAGARNPLRSQLFQHAGGFDRPQAQARRRLRGLPHPRSQERRARLEKERLGGVSRRLLFSRHRRIAPIRHCRRAASRSTPGSPTDTRNSPISPISTSDPETENGVVLHALLEGPNDRRRLPLPDDARQGRRHGHRLQAVPARRFRALWRSRR